MILDITSDLESLISELQPYEIIRSSKFSYRLANTADVIGHSVLDTGCQDRYYTPEILWSSVTPTLDNIANIYEVAHITFPQFLSGIAPSSSICRLSPLWLVNNPDNFKACPFLYHFLSLLCFNFYKFIQLTKLSELMVDDDDLIVRIPPNFPHPPKISSETSNLHKFSLENFILEQRIDALDPKILEINLLFDFHYSLYLFLNSVIDSKTDLILSKFTDWKRSFSRISSQISVFLKIEKNLLNSEDQLFLKNIGFALFVGQSNLIAEPGLHSNISFNFSMNFYSQIFEKFNLTILSHCSLPFFSLIFFLSQHSLDPFFNRVLYSVILSKSKKAPESFIFSFLNISPSCFSFLNPHKSRDFLHALSQVEMKTVTNCLLSRGRLQRALLHSLGDFEVLSSLSIKFDHQLNKKDLFTKIMTHVTAQIQSLFLIVSHSLTNLYSEFEFIYLYWYLDFLLGSCIGSTEPPSSLQLKAIKSLQSQSNFLALSCSISNYLHQFSLNDFSNSPSVLTEKGLLNFLKISSGFCFKVLVLCRSFGCFQFKSNWTKEQVIFENRFSQFGGDFLFSPLTFEEFIASSSCPKVSLQSLMMWIKESLNLFVNYCKLAKKLYRDYPDNFYCKFINSCHDVALGNYFIFERNLKKIHQLGIGGFLIPDIPQEIVAEISCKLDWKNNFFPIIKLNI
ncbi:hypothetical protein RCL1_004114 [Eukaryota sp. TZLM3-RCL]